MFHLRVVAIRNVVNPSFTPHLWCTKACVPPSISAGSAWHSNSQSSVLANTKVVALRGEGTPVCSRRPFGLVCKCHWRVSGSQHHKQMVEKAQLLHVTIKQRGLWCKSQGWVHFHLFFVVSAQQPPSLLLFHLLVKTFQHDRPMWPLNLQLSNTKINNSSEAEKEERGLPALNNLKQWDT